MAEEEEAAGKEAARGEEVGRAEVVGKEAEDSEAPGKEPGKEAVEALL